MGSWSCHTAQGAGNGGTEWEQTPDLAPKPCPYTTTGRGNVQPAGSSPCLWNSHHSNTQFQASSFVSAPRVRSFTASATVRCSSAAQFTVSEQFKTLTTSPKQSVWKSLFIFFLKLNIRYTRIYLFYFLDSNQERKRFYQNVT